MSFKDYCRRVLNEEADIISVKAKLDAKRRGLKHQSHNVWKDKGSQKYNWNKMLKRFERIEKIEGSKEEKHFEFTGKTTLENGIVLKQIRATKDLPMYNVERGEVGGWIEKPENLSGNAWVSGSAKVSGDAKVYGNAWVSGKAKVSGKAQISGNARISDNTWVSGNAKIAGKAWVFENAIVSGNAKIAGNAWVSGSARVSGDAKVYGDAKVFGRAKVSGDAKVSKNTKINTGEYK